MTSIFSGQLYRNLVKDQNIFRLENYDVNRYQRTVQQQSEQGLREKTLREGLEFQQAIMADLQTKLNEVAEKLNNLYRRFIENKAAFRKVSTENNYYDTSQTLNNLRSVTDTTAPVNSGYPAGDADIVPFDDPGRVKNYSYNPYFGSKAIDQSDKNVIRTYYQEEGQTSEDAYRENGAFWSTIGYLWGWDVDRINATYATTNKFLPVTGNSILTLDSTAGLSVGETVEIEYAGGSVFATVSAINGSAVTLATALNSLPPRDTQVSWDGGSGEVQSATSENYNNLQVNVVAVQPNREPSPPLRPGDRIAMTSGEHPLQPLKPYPSISIDGIRPGGADYNHAQFTETANEVGQDSLNWGWEFDDLPLALEVTSVKTNPDGSVQADGFKVVYDIKGNIPPGHPEYDRLMALDGTEPMIIDAPTDMTKVRINNNSFNYSGFVELGDVPRFSGNYSTPFDAFGGTGNQTSTNVSPHPGNLTFNTVTNLDFTTCVPVTIDAGMRLSFDYNFIMQQNAQTGGYASPGDDGYVPFYPSHNWSNNVTYWSGGTGPTDTDLSTTEFTQVINQQVQVGTGPFAGKLIMQLGSVPTTPGVDPFHSTGGYTPGAAYANVLSGNLGNGDNGLGPVRVNGLGGLVPGDQVEINGETRTINQVQGNFIYLDSPLSGTPAGSTQVFKEPGHTVATTVNGSNTGRGEPGGMLVDDVGLFTIGDTVTIYDSASPPGGTSWPATITGITNNDPGGTNQGVIEYSPPWVISGQPRILTTGRIEKSGGTPVTGGPNESVTLVFEPITGNPNTMRVGVVVDGDIHHFEIEVKNLKIVSYGPDDPGGWEQSLYVADDIGLGDGAPTVAGDPQDVVNKYQTDNYNFTQFFNEYNKPATLSGGVAADLNDIVRSPYEFGLLNIGRDVPPVGGAPGTGALSQLSGEMWIDLNDRRLNLGGDLVHDGTQLEDFDGQADWSATATTLNANYFSGANVQEAYAFVAPNDPEDDCIPGTTNGTGTRYGEVADSDPWTTDPLTDVSLAPTSSNMASTPADPMRADPSLNFGSSPGVYYTDDDTGNNLNGGTANGGGTADRVAGTDFMQYTVAIPTTDLNILRKENDLVFNLGSLPNRNYAIDINEPFIEYRTVSDYKTVPRYRVDSSGNIYDRFGFGYYNPANPDDASVLDDLYPTEQVGTPTTTVEMRNGQVSNHDGIYQNAASYNADGNWTNTTADRMSAAGDDYNLFDYVPDLKDDPNDPDPTILRGERYVGSLPTNFYYYREALDNGAGGNGVPTNHSNNGAASGTSFTNDNKPTLNFDARLGNIDGQYTDSSQRTTVYNTEMPSFVNVVMGYTEQKAILNNAQSQTTFLQWQGFPGLGGESSAAQVVVHPNPNDGTVRNPVEALGKSRDTAAEIRTGNDLQVEMFLDSDKQGHLLIYETYPSPTVPSNVFDTPVLSVSGNGTGVGAGNEIRVQDISGFAVGDSVYIGAIQVRISQIVNTGPGNNGTLRFDQDSPLLGDNNPPNTTAITAGARVTKYTPTYETAAHVVPLPLENGRDFTFESYAARKTVTRTGSETRGGITYLHVDSGTVFKNPPPPTMTVQIGSETRTITPDDVDITTHPHIIRVAALTTLPGADVPITMSAGEFTVNILDGALPNSVVSIEYDDQGTTLPGMIASVELSPEMDRVGRTIGDDIRTGGTPETDAIAPEYFDDQPRGYIQPDARLDLNLISRDLDGNQHPRRLKEVRVTLESGEQVILGAAGAITQEYSTNDANSAIGTTDGGLTDPFGTWPIALYNEQFEHLNPTPTADLGILVGYYQGITTITDASHLTLTDASEFNIGDVVTINGEQRTLTDVDPATGEVELDEPLARLPKYGDVMSLGKGDGSRQIQAYLNRSFSMSTNAPIKVDMIWQEYEVTGYPPTATLVTGSENNETVGFSTALPGQDPTTANFESANYNVVGDGRSGGAVDNEFTAELKRILDNPEYAELFRHDLFKNVFITASINDPFNDMITTKMMLTYDREKRRIELLQNSYMAYYKSV